MSNTCRPNWKSFLVEPCPLRSVVACVPRSYGMQRSHLGCAFLPGLCPADSVNHPTTSRQVNTLWESGALH